MKRLIQGLVRNLAVIVLVVAALVFGYLSRAWLVPSAPAARPSAAKKAELWVCAMNYNPHPYDSDDHRRRCRYCGMMLIRAEAAPASAGPRHLVMSERAKKLAGIKTALVERRSVSVELRLSGKVEYDETKLSYIAAWVPGRIDRLFVDYVGTPVAKGQHLAELYSPELVTTQEELLQSIRAVGELKASDIDIMRETAQATVDAARKRLRLMGLSQEQIAAIEKRGTAADHVTIRAPIGGIVTKKNVRLGQYVKTGTPLYTIADLSKVWVTLDAYESDLVWLDQGGQQATFTTDAYPGEKFHGRIAFVAPMVDKKTRSVEIRATVPNPDNRLKPGMLVSGIVRVEVAAGGKPVNRELAGKWLCTMHPDVVKETAGECTQCGMNLVRAEAAGYVSAKGQDKPLVVPATAPLLTGKRAIVYVEVPGAEEPTYVGREVTLGPRAGDYYILRAGLKEGERVVIEGNFAIDSDLQIKGRRSMMSPKGGAAGKAQPPPAKDKSKHRH